MFVHMLFVYKHTQVSIARHTSLSHSLQKRARGHCTGWAGHWEGARCTSSRSCYYVHKRRCISVYMYVCMYIWSSRSVIGSNLMLCRVIAMPMFTTRTVFRRVLACVYLCVCVYVCVFRGKLLCAAMA